MARTAAFVSLRSASSTSGSEPRSVHRELMAGHAARALEPSAATDD